MLVAFVGGAGEAIIFVCLFVLLVLVGTFLFTYASHSFVVVVQTTAAGNDDVRWPDEPLTDWVWQGALLAWLALVWLAPLGMILKAVSPGLLREDPALALFLAGGVLWLFFPVGVLSSMCSMSSLFFFSPKLLAGLARVGSMTLGFYAASFVLTVCTLLAWYIALFVHPILLPVAAMIGAAGVLVYARLLGRVAWKLAKLTQLKPRRVKKKAKKPRPAPSEPEPAAVPAQHSSEDEEGGTYGLAAAAAAPPAIEEGPRREGASYHMVADPDEPQIPPAPDLLRPIERKLARAQDRLIITEPPQSLWIGVWSFPWYETSMGAWVTLSAGALLAGGIVSLMLGGPPE